MDRSGNLAGDPVPQAPTVVVTYLSPVLRFEANLRDARLFKNVLATINTLMKEAEFSCDSAGIKLEAMDTSAVTIIQLSLASHAFVRYRCDRTIKLGVKVEPMTKIMDAAGKADTLTLVADDEPDDMTLKLDADMATSIGGDDHESGEKTPKKKVKWTRSSVFQLGLINIEQEARSIPAIEYPVTIEMNAKELRRIVKDLGGLDDDTLRIRVRDDNSVRFSVEGANAGNVTLRATESGSMQVEDEDGNTKSEDTSIRITNSLRGGLDRAYAMKFISSFSSAASICERVKLRLSDEMPLSVVCTSPRPPACAKSPASLRRSCTSPQTPSPPTRATRPAS